MAEPTFAPVAKALHEAFETFDRRGGPADASFEALVALCDAVSDGAERCVPFGAFDVARDACARRAALVAACGRHAAERPRRGPAPGRAPSGAGGVECAAAMQLQARVAACKLDDEAAQLEAISRCAKAALEALGDASAVYRSLGDDNDATRRLAGTMAKIGEVCATFGGNVDAALPALNEALTCYRRLPRSSDVDERVARAERAMAQCLELRETAVVPDGRIALNATETARALEEAQPRGALLDAYDFAVVVEEGDLAPRADSPRGRRRGAGPRRALQGQGQRRRERRGRGAAALGAQGRARRAVAAADAAADGEIHAVLLFRRRGDAEALPEAPRP
ncbi:hypothetical protein JL722_11487 [Aureococcus anophagefferens]|nr:hypothetical protein JL722_11487 [Aureococcus anophagefferens]